MKWWMVVPRFSRGNHHPLFYVTEDDEPLTLKYFRDRISFNNGEFIGELVTPT